MTSLSTAVIKIMGTIVKRKIDGIAKPYVNTTNIEFIIRAFLRSNSKGAFDLYPRAPFFLQHLFFIRSMTRAR